MSWVTFIILLVLGWITINTVYYIIKKRLEKNKKKILEEIQEAHDKEML